MVCVNDVMKTDNIGVFEILSEARTKERGVKGKSEIKRGRRSGVEHTVSVN